MRRFGYTAVDPGGKQRRGRVWARTEDDARRWLARARVLPTDIHPLRAENPLPVGGMEDRIGVLRALLRHLQAGASVRHALDSTLVVSRAGHVGQAAREAHEQVLQGEALSAALYRVGLVDARRAALLRTGESTGQLANTLGLAVHEMTHELESRRRLRAALAYPAVLGGTATLSMGILTFVVLPRYAAIVRDLGVVPTGVPGAVLAYAEALGRHQVAIVASVAVGTLGLIWALTVRASRARLAALGARLPLVAPVQRLREAAARARAVGTMLDAGIPLDRCLRVLMGQADDDTSHKCLLESVRAIESGRPISESLVATGFLPPTALPWLQVSDRTGGTATALLEIADDAEADARARVDALLVLLQPLIVLVFGGMIAAVASIILRTLYGITPTQS